MTRFAILSDPHANFEALNEVFKDIETFGVDRIYCLGDVVGYGPEPQKCVDLVREKGAKVVMGNHEQGLINIHYLRRFNQPAMDALRMTRELVTEETYQWLVTRPKAIAEDACRFVHGSPPDSVNEYIWKHAEDMTPVFRRYTEEFCFVGHTHELVRYSYRGGVSEKLPLPQGETLLVPDMRHLLNMGSVGQPRDGDSHAKYGVFDLEARTMHIRFVKYDIQKTVDLLKQHGFHSAFGDRLW
ncbi:metallophosphoesterase family protein [Pseudodesulfovibrio sediminis]|uniref:Phosphoesterase n=1 Tax=Pseudodesulfovibrio sediminis TaxID=2810563 RepID=A0ABM7P8G3_9BACT|nr:metallophosphoesterase family protein [Pseudodesulfovibrio sediminis]BCS89310.1 phosphoesterase [Pseudodesulfovibrio sediminis]